MKFIIKHRTCIFLLLLSSSCFLFFTHTNNNSSDISTLQKGISAKIVRFHVLANSDSDEDQALKLKVKDAVVNYISPLLKNSGSIEESKEILAHESEKIISIAKETISQNGYSYDVTAALTTCYFPTKQYGSFSFPPGNYEAYQIKIGKAQGHNWWCVLYPPLCFVDVAHGVVDNEGSEMLEDILTSDEYSAVSGNSHVKFKFKYLTFLNHLM